MSDPCATLPRGCGHGAWLPRLEEVKAAQRARPDLEADMKSRWIAVIAALALPALAWAGTKAVRAQSCPIGCKDCPFGQR